VGWRTAGAGRLTDRGVRSCAVGLVPGWQVGEVVGRVIVGVVAELAGHVVVLALGLPVVECGLGRRASAREGRDGGG
jgi:hypothetical protein